MLWRLVPSKLAEFVDFSLRSFNETKGYGFIESADTAAIYGKEQHGATGRSRSFEGCRLDDHGNKNTYLTFEVIKQLGFNDGFRAFLADFPWVFLWVFQPFCWGGPSLDRCTAVPGRLCAEDRAAGSVSRGSGAGSAWFHHVSWGKCGKISKQMDELLDFGAI